MKWPADKFLQYVISWFITGWFWQLIFSQQHSSATVSETIGRVFINLLSPMMFGAICSEFPLVSWTAAGCGMVFVSTLTIGTMQSAYAAKYALASYFMLTMFTLWVEPWVTLSGLAIMFVEILLKMSSMIVDVGISFFALMMWQKAASHVDSELST
jgi:hypothetical protein